MVATRNIRDVTNLALGGTSALSRLTVFTGTADLLNGLFTQVVPAGGASGIVKNAYLGAKRYIRAKFTVTTAASTGAATYAANVIKGHLRYSV